MMSSNAKTQSRQDAKGNSPGGFESLRPCVSSLSRAVWIAVAFCLLVSGYMLYQHALASERDPWKSPQLLGLKEKLRAAPNDEAIKTEIRRLDLEFRQRYKRRLALDATGGWLLVGGVAVLLLAARPSVKWQTPQWLPKLRPDAGSESRRYSMQARWSVAVTGAVVGVVLLSLALEATSPLSDLNSIGLKAGANEITPRAPTLAELEFNWPQFRGMNGGETTNTLGFDARSAIVIWKTPIPSAGFNSPVVWSNRVFISGGDVTKREVFCFDTADGKLLWRRAIENVPGAPAKLPEIPDATGWAAPTMSTDGCRAFAIFVNGDLAAVNFDGSVAWSKHLGVPKNMYGHASSLAIAPGKLIVQREQDEGAPGGSTLLAFDCATGRKLWERAKPTHSSWTSPIIATAAGKSEIVTLALPFVMSHALTDGSELWRADVMDGEITPSPIVAGGLVVAVSPNVGLLALRPNGAGDVTKSHVAWKVEENAPDVTSPVSNGELVYTVTSSGGVGCFDLKDGKQVWQKDLELEVQSSPAIAGKQLLILSTKGDLVSLEAAREFKELGRAKLEDTFHASPAFANNRVIVRGATNLWCLGKTK
jgi:outer membrane protein assembly factor BamB